MRQETSLRAMAVAALTCSIFMGCGKPTGRATGPQADAVKPPTEIQTSDSSGGVTGIVSSEVKLGNEAGAADTQGQFALTLSGTMKNLDELTDGRLSGRGQIPALGGSPGIGFDGSTNKVRQTLLLPDGTTYVGEVTDGQPDGHGTLITPNGTNQQGEWREGKAYRLTGKWVAPDGTVEEGTWYNDGTKCGGTITWKDGRVYKGDWRPVDGAPELPEGTGTMTWPDGRTYVGEFRDGQMNGKGKMIHANGGIEDGNWSQDKFVGVAK